MRCNQICAPHAQLLYGGDLCNNNYTALGRLVMLLSVTVTWLFVCQIVANLSSLQLKSTGCAPLKTPCQSCSILAPTLHSNKLHMLPQVSFPCSPIISRCVFGFNLYYYEHCRLHHCSAVIKCLFGTLYTSCIYLAHHLLATCLVHPLRLHFHV